MHSVSWPSKTEASSEVLFVVITGQEDRLADSWEEHGCLDGSYLCCNLSSQFIVVLTLAFTRRLMVGLISSFSTLHCCSYLASKSVGLAGFEWKTFFCLQNSTQAFSLCFVQLYIDLQFNQLILINQLIWIWIIDYQALEPWIVIFQLRVEIAPYLYGHSSPCKTKTACKS